MRILKKFLIVVLVAFVALQFFRSAKNDAAPDARDLFAMHPAPSEVRRLVESSCYDCHSNRTRYPWYSQIQPVRWWLDGHIRDGKRELNFSEFGDYSDRHQVQKLLAVSDEIIGKTMPLESYTWSHREARLTDKQIAMLTEWAEELADALESK